MKAVLMSIQPKWCELIASGKKTIEVRKTKPKIEAPFKVYIYETQGRKYSFNVKADTIAKHDDDRFLDCARGNPPIKEDKNGTPYFSYGRMKVIGEFVCDGIDEYTNYSLDEQYGHIKRRENLLRSACMTLKDWRDYIGSYISNFGYAWHISNLVIYDKPRELSEFRKPCDYDLGCKCCSMYFPGTMFAEPYCKNGNLKITRPPQSWCYVERLGEG